MRVGDHDHAITRRRLLGGVGRCACLLPVAALLHGARAHAGSPLSVAELLRELDDASRSLRSAALDGPDWQLRAQALLTRVDPKQLRDAIDIDWRALASDARSHGRAEQRLAPAQLREGPREAGFRAKLFVMATATSTARSWSSLGGCGGGTSIVCATKPR
jgi:hypothetical protein